MWKVITETEYKALKSDLYPICGGQMFTSGNFIEHGRGGQSMIRKEYRFLQGSVATEVNFKFEETR